MHVARTGERQGMHTEFWWRNLFENGHLEDRGGYGIINTKMDIKKIGCEGGRQMKLAG